MMINRENMRDVLPFFQRLRQPLGLLPFDGWKCTGMKQKHTHVISKIKCTPGRNSRKRKHRIIIGGAFSFVFQFLDVFETVDTPILVVPGTTKFMVVDGIDHWKSPERGMGW